jgi:enoyl-CoA hydratase/carnithine racemase
MEKLPSHPQLLLHHENRILYMTLNQPEKMNAMKDDMLDVFCQVVDAIENEDEVHVVVVRGAGPCFSSGYDIGNTGESWRERADSEANRRFFKRRYSFLDRVWNSPKPFIASVHSYCLAAASDLSNMCDITIASDDAVFGYPAVRWGGHTHRLTYPWNMPFKKAKEMMFTGDRITAQEAERRGMVNYVVPRAELEAKTKEVAERLLMTPLSGLIVNKISMNYARNVQGFQQAMQYSFQMAETNLFRKNEFFERAKEGGLKEALGWRDSKYGDRKN